ncbi:MAG TPA: glucose-6-phosphate dehydrogenase (NADP(+)) [Pseudonocardiaceae bacterium]|nr:glucose-6-phosphate dehydrogenase (NADP(+)) [Pseudonocardiaceae bacterium]
MDTASGARPDSTLFVLFGATGDLAKRMVLPAFYQLHAAGLLPEQWRLVGNGRGDVSHLDFRDYVHGVLTEFSAKPDPEQWQKFADNLYFAGGGFATDDPGSLLDVIEHVREGIGPDAQFVHYLAVPPVAFESLTAALGQHGLTEGARAVYEKPFGTSPEGFRKLDDAVHKVLDESQVYRIDHFLGKEGTQDLHVLRFANKPFEASWSREHVKAVQIDVPETLDIADRAGFYDATGATLDMLVTHLFQVAAEVAMEPPASLDPEDLQAARESVIAAFRPLDPAEIVFGQYDGYRETDGIADDSTTETYVAARLWVDTDRWRGVPFLLRTGKQLARSQQVVSLLFRDPEGPLKNLPRNGNVLQFSLAGSGKVILRMVVKEPGVTLEFDTSDAEIDLATVPNGHPIPPYARLVHDVLLGDRSLFTRPDGLADVWEVAGPLLDHKPTPFPYAAGSWGPAAADELAAPDGWLLGSDQDGK